MKKVRSKRVREDAPTNGATSNPIRILHTDALQGLKSVATASIQACVTSPPFYLMRRYGSTTTWPDGWEGELGHESHPNEFIRHLLSVFDEVWRTLRDDACLWVNLADTFNNKQGKKGTTNAPNGSGGRFAAGGKGYAKALRQQPEFFKHYVSGIGHKSEMGVPQRFHLAMTDHDFRRFVGAPPGPQWICRRTVIWAKSMIHVESQKAEGNAMPEPTRDRPSRNYEFLYLFSKRPVYYFDRTAIDVQSRASSRKGDLANAGSVWQTSADGNGSADREFDPVWRVNPEASPYQHIAMWPKALVRQMLLPTTREGDTVLDPFAGSGTTGEVAADMGRKAVLIESSRPARWPSPIASLTASRSFFTSRVSDTDAPAGENPPPEIIDRAFGATNRARLLKRYFENSAAVTAANAWEHVYRLLLWIDRTTALAHCYESDKAQPGRTWYARSLAFHDWLSDELRATPAALAEEIDWLFREAIKDLATRLVTSRSASYERQRLPYGDRGFPEPGEDPELAAIILETLHNWMNPAPPAEVVSSLTRRIHALLSQENKRKNLVGEGFEDIIAAILLRLSFPVPLEVRTRVPLHDLRGFHRPSPNEKIKKVDLGLISGDVRILVTAKWSIRADREEQFMSDFQAYERLESAGEDFGYVLITNEFDAARLRAACERRRQNAPLFTHVVHINPEAIKVVYSDTQSEGAVAVREHIAKGRLISLSAWLTALRGEAVGRG